MSNKKQLFLTSLLVLCISLIFGYQVYANSISSYTAYVDSDGNSDADINSIGTLILEENDNCIILDSKDIQKNSNNIDALKNELDVLANNVKDGDVYFRFAIRDGKYGYLIKEADTEVFRPFLGDDELDAYYTDGYSQGYIAGKAAGMADSFNSMNMTVIAHFHTANGDGMETFTSYDAYERRKNSASASSSNSSSSGCYKKEEHSYRSCGCGVIYGGNQHWCGSCGHYHPWDGQYANICGASVVASTYYSCNCGYKQGEIISITLNTN